MRQCPRDAPRAVGSRPDDRTTNGAGESSESGTDRGRVGWPVRRGRRHGGTSGPILGRHDGRRVVVKRYGLIAAVGAVATLTALLSGATAYGGESESAQARPIKLGVITPLTPGASNFVPWGQQ